MAKRDLGKPADYIAPLYITGLQGRMLSLPPPKTKKRHILFVYGQHSSLEKWWGLAQDLQQYGSVTIPDLPGYGGMDSFYRRKQQPTLDNLADYLAAFIKLRFKNRRLTIIGYKFGFVIVTRMLQRCPDLVPRVDLLISLNGYAHKGDFTLPKTKHIGRRMMTALLSRRLPALFFRNVCLHPGLLQAYYGRKLQPGTGHVDRRDIADFEIHLWHANDVRTHMRATNELLRLDNCRAQVDVVVWHIGRWHDDRVDAFRVEQHLSVIFSKVHMVVSDQSHPLPVVISDRKTARPLLPKQVRSVLAKA